LPASKETRSAFKAEDPGKPEQNSKDRKRNPHRHFLQNKDRYGGNIRVEIAFSAGYPRYYKSGMFTLLIRIISVNFAGIVTEFKSDLLKWDYSIS
jgi:hypothetical protein